MTKKTCLLRTFACLLGAGIPAAAQAQELIVNGNFEAAALSAPWEPTTSAGTSVSLVNENSPFRTIYPAGTKSLRLADDDVEFETPSIQQSFAPRNGVRFAFDFKAPAAAPGSAWYVIWRGEEDTTAFFFAIGGQDGASFDFNQNRVSAIEANLWYHVEGTADVPNQIVSGAIQNSRGDRVSFVGGFPFGVRSVVEAVTITDGDQGQNGAILFDNLSAQVTTIALPSLNIVRGQNGEVTVSWTASGFNLQASSELGPTANWQTVATAVQTYTAPAEDPVQFYRLVSQ